MREIPTDSELTEKMEELNKMFAELVEDWQLMPIEAQQEYCDWYLVAQKKFHANGAKLVDRLMPVDMESLPPLTKGELENAPQLHFGDMTNVQANETITTSASGAPESVPVAPVQVEKMSIDDEAKSTDPNDVQNVPPKLSCISPPSFTTLTELNEAIQLAQKKNEEMRTDLETVSYELHGTLFEEIFKLPRQDKPNPLEMEKMVKAIEIVTEQLNKMGLRIHPMVQRMLILHVVWSMDPQSRECWEYKVGFLEPTIPDLINFINGRKNKIQANFQKFTIPRVEKVIEKRQTQVEPKPSTSKQRVRSGSESSTGSKSVPAKKKANNCYLCKDDHHLISCPTFRRLSKEARETEVTRLGLCKNCFDNKHKSILCPRKNSCTKECKRKHSTMLHCQN